MPSAIQNENESESEVETYRQPKYNPESFHLDVLTS